VPGHLARWAESKIKPVVDWRRALAGAIRAALADTAGAVDYTYRRPSRRQAALPDVILPALRRPTPEVAVVLDTSGSIDDAMLGAALSELGGVLRAAGQRGVHLIVCDATVHAVARVRRVEDARQHVAGGGGTDLRAGLAAAARLRPRPQVIVVLTDAETEWPDRPPAGARVVVARFGSGKAPLWARVVDVKE